MTSSGPTIIGIGAQKCASSWVHAAMGAHPEVGVSDPKELDYFSYYFDRGHRWYEGFFAGLVQPQRFESSPSYFYDPRSPERALAYDPALKILLMLRDPVERAYSNHLHEVIKGHIPAIGFDEGMANNPTYLEQSLYHKHTAHWLSVFPRDQVLILLAEEVAADPQSCARRLYEFAGVAADFTSAVLAERRNESDRARLPALRKVLRRGGDWMRRNGMEEALARVKARGPVANLLRANSINMRHDVPAMDNDTRARLDAALSDDLHALAALLGRDDLPWPTWGRLRQRD